MNVEAAPGCRPPESARDVRRVNRFIIRRQGEELLDQPGRAVDVPRALIRFRPVLDEPLAGRILRHASPHPEHAALFVDVVREFQGRDLASPEPAGRAETAIRTRPQAFRTDFGASLRASALISRCIVAFVRSRILTRMMP